MTGVSHQMGTLVNVISSTEFRLINLGIFTVTKLFPLSCLPHLNIERLPDNNLALSTIHQQHIQAKNNPVADLTSHRSDQQLVPILFHNATFCSRWRKIGFSGPSFYQKEISDSSFNSIFELSML